MILDMLPAVQLCLLAASIVASGVLAGSGRYLDSKFQWYLLVERIWYQAVKKQSLRREGALTQFFNQTNGTVEEGELPKFTSKYQSNAPKHKMQKNDDGSYRVTFEIDGSDWRQSELEYDLLLVWCGGWWYNILYKPCAGLNCDYEKHIILMQNLPTKVWKRI